MSVVIVIAFLVCMCYGDSIVKFSPDSFLGCALGWPLTFKQKMKECNSGRGTDIVCWRYVCRVFIFKMKILHRYKFINLFFQSFEFDLKGRELSSSDQLNVQIKDWERVGRSR